MTTDTKVGTTRPAVIIAASILLAVLALLPPVPEGLSENARVAAVIGAVMAAWWMSETVPLPGNSAPASRSLSCRRRCQY